MPKGRPKGFDEGVVLEKAMRSFWREGYEGASMAILLRDMGISRQSLYDTYGDKRTLFLRALNLYIDREIGALLDELAAPPPMRPQLLKVITHFRAMADEKEPCGCFLANSLVGLKAGDGELRNLLAKTLTDLQRGMRRAVQSAVDLGEIQAPKDVEVLSRGIVSSLMGMAVTSKAKAGPGASDESANFLLGQLVEA